MINERTSPNVQIRKLTLILLLLLFVFLFSSKVLLAVSSYGPQIKTSSYILSRSLISRSVGQGNIFYDSLRIDNLRNSQISVSFSTSTNLGDVISLNSSTLNIGPLANKTLNFLIIGKSIGNYSGTLEIQGDITQSIPVNISVTEQSFNAPILLDSQSSKNTFNLGGNISFSLDVEKLKPTDVYGAVFNYTLSDKNNNSYFLGSEILNITSSFQLLKTFAVPENASKGDYILTTVLSYDNTEVTNELPLALKIAFLHIMVFNFIPMWLLLVIVGTIFAGALGYIFVKRFIDKRKKYRMELDLKTLPKKTPGFFYLGKVAEKNHDVFFDPLKLKTHSIVAGATGGGKSITAQVIIEEALMNKVAVIVFDPTAQWSGMLRKCTDKKMLAYYPRFGLKEADAKAFKGNVREVKDAREYIDIKKHMNPGEIQIFSLNKLQPKDMDVFVSNVIRGIFESDPQEAQDLKLILVFDEVHRLLSKFGGSGEGFLQIERACREFRKWGMGVMLVSQVLADFVGEIKANISTELQMRTRDEGDLNRIKTKYGEDFLQSLVKASVGVGMFVNPAYNHGKPFFINFRPILHNTRRLSDEELDKYNKYNDVLDDLEYQIEQLEQLKVDAFDFKMELKLMKDKLMSGNFSVVEIYLEGLKPRITKEWQKLGRTPQKRQLKLVSQEEIQKSVAEAQKSRAAFEKDEAVKSAKEAANKKPEEKKENLDAKIVNPLTFDNGAMVSSLKELKDLLPNLPDDIFATHVNAQKNDIGKWIADNFGDNSINAIKTKPEMIKALLKIKPAATPAPAPATPAQPATSATTPATPAQPAPAPAKPAAKKTARKAPVRRKATRKKK